MAEDSSTKCSKIRTATDFLYDVREKGYSESMLKQYLIEKRYLTTEEVDVALMINRNRLKNAKDNGTKEGTERSGWFGNSDRPEKTMSITSRNPIQDVAYLIQSKQQDGQKLINVFLDKEKEYCGVLRTLKEQYDRLAEQADKGKLQVSRIEIERMFKRIPEFLVFHEGFFLDLKRGAHIGNTFVRMFKFFERYAEFMKDCQKAVDIMRKYIQDENLWDSFRDVKTQSERSKDDVFDLLLFPLDRIAEYKEFLDNLLRWADRTQTTDYEVLGKASRRIGRVSTYIEKYKHGISNQNEMNKVQRFLGNDHDILTPDRVIIRRGTMLKLTSGWTSRNKRYVFFLFNNMLLWTSINGKLQKAVHLRKCEILPSKSKNNANIRFNIVIHNDKRKILRLKCDGEKQKIDWFLSIKRTIASAKVKWSKAWQSTESASAEKYQDYSGDLSDEDSKVKEPTEVTRGEDEDIRLEASEVLEDPYNKRFADTSSFIIQRFREIAPMGDNVSEVSDWELSLRRGLSDTEEGMLSTSAQLSPFKGKRRHMKGACDSQNSTSLFEVRSTTSSGSNRSLAKAGGEPPCRQSRLVSKETNIEFGKSKISRSPSSKNDTQDRKSQFTLRLDNF